MKLTGLIILISFVLFCGCALQRDLVALNDRVFWLERQNLDLKKRLELINSEMDHAFKRKEQKNQLVRLQSAKNRAALDELRKGSRFLKGKIEEIEFLLNKKTIQLEKISRLNKKRIKQLEQYLNYDSFIDSDKKAVSKDKVSNLDEKKLSDYELYKSAKQKFDQNDFEGARKGFLNLIKKNPKSEQADNAQFWIGETYYREKWFEKAILEYQKVIEKYPKGNKVPAALLKQGLAFLNIGDKTNFRLVMKKLIKKYPKTTESEIAKKKLKQI